MEELKIGTKVRVSAISNVEYTNEKDKLVVKNTLEWPLDGYIIGKRKKGVGKYVRAAYEDPPRLKVDKYIWFYEFRETLTSTPFLVQIEDIKVIREDR